MLSDLRSDCSDYHPDDQTLITIPIATVMMMTVMMMTVMVIILMTIFITNLMYC